MYQRKDHTPKVVKVAAALFIVLFIYLASEKVSNILQAARQRATSDREHKAYLERDRAYQTAIELAEKRVELFRLRAEIFGNARRLLPLLGPDEANRFASELAPFLNRTNIAPQRLELELQVTKEFNDRILAKLSESRVQSSKE